MSDTIEKSLTQNMLYFDELLQLDQSFDLMKRLFLFGEKKACLYYVNGLVNDELIQKLMQFFYGVKPEDFGKDIEGVLKRDIPYNEIDQTNLRKDIVTNILSGLVVLLIDGYADAVIMDCRDYPARGVSEPEKDKVMRGSKDGFIETIVCNTALIRRRIRTPELIMKMMRAGDSSKTDICVCYMDGRANEKVLNKLVKQVEGLQVDSLTMNQESLAECLYRQSWINPFPKFKYTERPDTAAACLYEGNIVILVDNSPSAMIIPTSLFDIIEEADDYYFPPVTGTYLRLTRFLIGILALIVSPLYVLLMDNPQWIPKAFEFILVKDTMNIPLIWQFLILELAIDGLRLAAISTPNMLSTPLSVIAGIVIGDFAVQSGWFNPETMVYMAFVAVASYTQSSFELSYAIKFMRLITLIITAVFGVWGFSGGILLTLLCIAFNRSYGGISYIYPIIPFNPRKLLRRFLRVSLPKSENQ